MWSFDIWIIGKRKQKSISSKDWAHQFSGFLALKRIGIQHSTHCKHLTNEKKHTWSNNLKKTANEILLSTVSIVEIVENVGETNKTKTWNKISKYAIDIALLLQFQDSEKRMHSSAGGMHFFCVENYKICWLPKLLWLSMEFIPLWKILYPFDFFF